MSIGESILHETFLTLYSKSEFFFLFLTHLINATTFFKRNFHGLVLFYITIFDYIELRQSNCAKNFKKNFKKNAEMLTYRRRSCRPTEIPFLLNQPQNKYTKNKQRQNNLVKQLCILTMMIRFLWVFVFCTLQSYFAMRCAFNSPDSLEYSMFFY